jgi:hypothetical protein
LDATTSNSTSAIAGPPCSQCVPGSAQSLYQCASNLCYLPALAPALASLQALIVQMPDKPKVGISFGGHLDDTPITVSTSLMLELWGVNVSITNHPARVSGLLSAARYDLLVLPGSNHDTSDLPDVLNATGGAYRAAVQQYMAGGGHFVGICYGAFAASDAFLDLLPGLHTSGAGFDEDSNRSDQLVPVQMPGEQPPGGVVPLQEGPILSPTWDTKQGFGVFTTKPKSQAGHPIATLSVYGNGTVGLISPHFEAGPNW